MKGADVQTTAAISIEALLAEFEQAYTKPERIPENVQGIVILTADNIKEGDGQIENVSRIKHALGLARQFTSRLPVIFNGVAEEQDLMMNLMLQMRALDQQIFFQNCGNRGPANTITQFAAIRNDELTRQMRSLVLVTNTYHVPRVRRTAGKQLPEEMKFIVSSCPEDDSKMNNTFIRIMGEIRRIQQYSEKGDILAVPR